MARQIDQCKQEIAGFFSEFVGIAAIERGFDLVGFLADLVQHRARIVPVEADAGGLALQFHRPRQRRLSGLDAGQQRLVRSFRRPPRRAFGFLLGLDAIPGVCHMRGRQAPILVGEDMRVPPDHLSGDRLDHIAEGEGILLLRHAGVIHHLQQEIAEFVAQIFEIAARDGVGDLIGFLDGVGGDGRKILFEIPRTAAAGRAQRRHDLEQA